MTTIEKTTKGYRENRGDDFTFILEWDTAGKYLGQWQDDMLSEDGGFIFIGKGWSVPDLTEDQMKSAEQRSRAHPCI